MPRVTARTGSPTRPGNRCEPVADDLGVAANVDDAAAPRSQEDRCRMIAEAAYYRAEARSFAPGHEIEDWLQAEKDIDAACSPTAGN